MSMRKRLSIGLTCIFCFCAGLIIPVTFSASAETPPLVNSGDFSSDGKIVIDNKTVFDSADFSFLASKLNGLNETVGQNSLGISEINDSLTPYINTTRVIESGAVPANSSKTITASENAFLVCALISSALASSVSLDGVKVSEFYLEKVTGSQIITLPIKKGQSIMIKNGYSAASNYTLYGRF